VCFYPPFEQLSVHPQSEIPNKVKLWSNISANFEKKLGADLCRACKYLPILGSIYCCFDCSFYVHERCIKKHPREKEHPHHPKHSLLRSWLGGQWKYWLWLWGVALRRATSASEESYYLVVWFRVVRRPGFIRNFKGKRLIVARKGISTPITPYLRETALCGLDVV
jgi:hypothetical protein